MLVLSPAWTTVLSRSHAGTSRSLVVSAGFWVVVWRALVKSWALEGRLRKQFRKPFERSTISFLGSPRYVVVCNTALICTWKYYRTSTLKTSTRSWSIQRISASSRFLLHSIVVIASKKYIRCPTLTNGFWRSSVISLRWKSTYSESSLDALFVS